MAFFLKIVLDGKQLMVFFKTLLSNYDAKPIKKG